MTNRKNRQQKRESAAPNGTQQPRVASDDAGTVTLSIGRRQVAWSVAILLVGAVGILWASGSTPSLSVPDVDHTSSLWLIFLTGLSVGGLSCLAVQGGLLAAMIAQRESRQEEERQLEEERGDTEAQGWRRSLPVAQFLLAKTIAYAALGALLGAFGALIPISLQAWLMIAAGVFMVMVVLQMFDVHPFFRRIAISPPKSMQRYIRGKSKGDGRSTPFALGALTVFIPCGVTLAMEALAIASNDPIRGALIMTAFVLGTAPLFLFLGLAATRMSQSATRTFRAVAAVAIVAVAAMSMLSGARLLGVGASLVSGETQKATIVEDDVVAAAVAPAAVGGSETAGAYSPASSVSQDGVGAQPATGPSSGAYQEATIDIATGQYHPSVVQVKAGLPTRLSLNTMETRGCIRAFVIPSLGIQAMLEETGSQVVELPPAQPGRIPFMCSMGMYTGVIEVVN